MLAIYRKDLKYLSAISCMHSLKQRPQIFNKSQTISQKLDKTDLLA